MKTQTKTTARNCPKCGKEMTELNAGWACIDTNCQKQTKTTAIEGPAFTTQEQADQLSKGDILHMLHCAEACLHEKSRENAKLRVENIALAAVAVAAQATQAFLAGFVYAWQNAPDEKAFAARCDEFARKAEASQANMRNALAALAAGPTRIALAAWDAVRK
jgi:hypothetical protein